MHRLLERQLRRLGLDRAAPPTAEQWSVLLDVVDQAYTDGDQDRETAERSLTISSREMRELYDNLCRSTASQLADERDKLRRLTAFQTAAFEASPDGVVVLDTDQRVVIFNRRLAEMWNIPIALLASGDTEAAIGIAISQVVDPEAFLDRVRHLQNDPMVHSYDELRLHDGRIVERFTRPAIDNDGALCGRLWLFRDITGRRLADQRVRDALHFVDSIVETIPNMVFVKDAEQLRFVLFNRAGEVLTGMQREQVLGRSDHDLFPASQADQFTGRDREVLSQRGVVTIEEELIETESGVRKLRTRKTPICDPDGEPRYLLGISEDITEERERAAELYLAKERAETASRAKSEFLLNMSHELRTPLNAILGFTRVLARGARPRLTPDEREHLLDIERAGDHMLQLINDLLDLRSLEAHGLELGPVELLPQLDEAARMVAPLIRERSHTFELDVATDLPPCLGARRAIVQALINLLTNATKYTDEGGHIALRAFREGALIRLQVSDTGMGISGNDQAKLFVYFEMLHAKHSHHMRGSGIGLALTRALVEKMGGTISVTSEVGVGSTFEIKLRAA